MKINIVFLIEQSYVDSNIKNNLIKSFYLNYKLSYINQTFGSVPGNVGALVGSFTSVQFKQFVRLILNDLDKYHPFLRFIGLNYNNYWISSSQITSLLKLNFNETSKYEAVTSSFLYPMSNLNQAFITPITSILLLLEKKNEFSNES